MVYLPRLLSKQLHRTIFSAVGGFMKRCSIIFHSVCGNNYLIASAFQEALQEEGFDARLYNVKDEDLHIWSNRLESANDFYEEINNLPTANYETLVKSDLVILGSPTYFGNVSAEMKRFMDESSIYFYDGTLSGKYFGCFTSCSQIEGGGTLCLQSMIHYAQHMGMVHVPLGMQVQHIDPYQPPAGIMHHSGKESSIRPSSQLGSAVVYYSRLFAKKMLLV